MVKGVNKTVIEVNDTGSKLFEKIVFYVTPQYGSLSAKQLKKAAREFTFNYDEAAAKRNSVRNRLIRKRRIAIGLLSGGILLFIGVILLLIL